MVHVNATLPYKILIMENTWRRYQKYCKKEHKVQKQVLSPEDSDCLGFSLIVCDFADFKQSRRALDAGVAERIFTFSFDILDNWEEKGNLHNFEAHMKLRSTVFLKVRRGDSPSSNQA